MGVHETKLGKVRVLVVDDDDGMRRVVAKQLAGLGYHVFEAADAVAAIATLRHESEIALLLTDIVMPGGRSGADLAREARAMIPGLKILLTSGYPEVRADIGNWPDADVRLLGKPYRVEKLAQVVREVLDA